MTAFPEVQKIRYEGPKSKNPLTFRWYNADEVVEGKTMKDHFRFSVVYWHTFRGTGSDPFGPGTMLRPWDDGSNSVEKLHVSDHEPNTPPAAPRTLQKYTVPEFSAGGSKLVDVMPDWSTVVVENVWMMETWTWYDVAGGVLFHSSKAVGG